MAAILWLMAGVSLGIHFNELVNMTISWMDLCAIVVPLVTGMFVK